MIFKINLDDDGFLQNIYNSSMKELDEFFEIGWKVNKPNIIIVPDRKTIDLLKGEKTEDWIVGWKNGTNVFVLDRDNYEQESRHKYSEEEYSALIKHELAHAFTRVLSGYNNKPKWLWEGLAIYLSGQNKFKKKPAKFTRFLDYYDNSGVAIYEESGFAVEILIEGYGKGKMLKLIKSLKDIHSEEDFANKFRDIYGFELDYERFR